MNGRPSPLPRVEKRTAVILERLLVAVSVHARRPKTEHSTVQIPVIDNAFSCVLPRGEARTFAME